MQPQRLTKLWEATQVELQGRYSNQRVLNLARYTRETSSLRALALVVASTFPCLLVQFLFDAIPLADPSEGVAANQMFFVREFFNLLMTTGMVILQFRRGMHNILPYPPVPFVRDSVVVAALTTGLLYKLAQFIGFPVPFSPLVLLPAWSVMTLSAMAFQWARSIREKPPAKAMLVGVSKLLLCDVLLIFIYPPYYCIFTTLPEKSQTGFTVLLPVIKLLMRNLFARAVRHLGDETPELVIFNADAFGSLFVSYCMQSSPSIWSTVVIIIADVALIALSLRDILHCREGLEELEHQIDCGPVWGLCCDTAGYKLLGGRKPTTLERAGILLEQGEPYGFQHLRSTDSRAATVLPLDPSHQRSGYRAGDRRKKDWLMTDAVESGKDSRDYALLSYIARTSTAWMGANIVYPEETNYPPRERRSSNSQISKRYVLKVRRLLYMAEFLLLLNYIEVVIPQIFAIYLIVTYHLPNREYYAVFHNMNESQLYATLKKLLVYWFLQALSLVVLDMLLRHILGMSPIRVLAFVLEKQADYVQIHLIYWLSYNAKCSLKHIDFTYIVIREKEGLALEVVRSRVFSVRQAYVLPRGAFRLYTTLSEASFDWRIIASEEHPLEKGARRDAV